MIMIIALITANQAYFALTELAVATNQLQKDTIKSTVLFTFDTISSILRRVSKLSILNNDIIIIMLIKDLQCT